MTDLQTYITAGLTAVVGLFVAWLARKVAKWFAAVARDLSTELREIARIPAEVSALVGAVAALVSELRAVKSRIDQLETAFAALDMTPDHVTMTMLATHHHEHDDQERQDA